MIIVGIHMPPLTPLIIYVPILCLVVVCNPSGKRTWVTGRPFEFFVKEKSPLVDPWNERKDQLSRS